MDLKFASGFLSKRSLQLISNFRPMIINLCLFKTASKKITVLALKYASRFFI